MKIRWPQGFIQDRTQSWWINDANAEDFWVEKMKPLGVAWAESHVTDPDQREWIFGFAEYIENRLRSASFPRTWREPKWSTWWKAYYAEPVGEKEFLDSEEEETT